MTMDHVPHAVVLKAACKFKGGNLLSQPGSTKAPAMAVHPESTWGHCNDQRAATALCISRMGPMTSGGWFNAWMPGWKCTMSYSSHYNAWWKAVIGFLDSHLNGSRNGIPMGDLIQVAVPHCSPSPAFTCDDHGQSGALLCLRTRDRCPWRSQKHERLVPGRSRLRVIRGCSPCPGGIPLPERRTRALCQIERGALQSWPPCCRQSGESGLQWMRRPAVVSREMAR